MPILRRQFLALPVAAARLFGSRKDCSPQEGRVPSDPEQINVFVREFNDYTHTLTRGVIDLKRWKKVEERWKAMTRE
jgi:hypothetical protein